MPSTIGEILKQTRLDRKLTVKSVSEATAIRAKFLDALEADDFDSLPSPVQARGFLRIYAEFLGLDAEPLLADLRGEVVPEEAIPAETDIPGSPGEEVSSGDISIIDEDASSRNENNIAIPASSPDDFDRGDSPEPQLEVSNLPLPLSQSIFVEIGRQLKGRRELLSLSLDEIERHTHIRKHYLLALEAGAISELPSPVQARGILASYARFLDLDSESLLLRYAEGLQASQSERHPRKPRIKAQDAGKGSTAPSAFHWLFSTDMIFGGGMILAMIAFAIWGANRIISQSEISFETDSSDQSISEVLLAATVVTAETAEVPTLTLGIASTPNSTNATPTVFEIPAPVESSPVQVITAVTGNTWMRVTVDGDIEFQGRAIAGSAFTFNGDQVVGVLAADGSLVQIVFNGEDLGPMGDSGEIIEMIYTTQGILLPTPTKTATPTRTPRVTPTFTPSITPQPGSALEPSE